MGGIGQVSRLPYVGRQLGAADVKSLKKHPTSNIQRAKSHCHLAPMTSGWVHARSNSPLTQGFDLSFEESIRART